METENNSGSITRKTFLRGMTATLGSGLLAPAIFNGAAWAEEAKPQAGGVLRMNISSIPANFDPISNTSTTVMEAIGPCYNGLVRADPMNPYEIIPDLATDWEFTDEGRTLTFNLVKTARFHDGKPMTAEDARFTFDYIRNPPDGVASARKGLLSNVEAIEAPDDHTLIFRLKEPTPSLLASLSSCWMLVQPKHVLERTGPMKDEIIGTGPFRLKEHVRGVSIELERNSDYHVAERPYLDGIKLFIIPDGGTTTAYLLSGQLDWYVSMRGQDSGSVQSNDKVEILSGPSTTLQHLMFNTTKPPFDDLRVRKALSLAIDRNGARQVVSNGHGAFGGLMPPGQWALSDAELDTIPGYGSNTDARIEEAKQLLAEAGYANGLSINLLVRQNPLFEPLGIFAKDQWAKIGVDASLNIMETAAFREALSSGNYQVTTNGLAAPTYDPDALYGSFFTCGAGGNATGTCVAEVDALFAQASIEMNPDKRAEMVRQMERTIIEDYSVYVIYHTYRFMGLSRRVHGMVVHPNVDQNMRMEHIWLSS